MLLCYLLLIVYVVEVIYGSKRCVVDWIVVSSGISLFSDFGSVVYLEKIVIGRYPSFYSVASINNGPVELPMRCGKSEGWCLVLFEEPIYVPGRTFGAVNPQVIV